MLRMLAALHGRIWTASQVGQSLGLSYHTVNSYLDYLVGAFLIRRLQPYQTNIRKRLVKSPKVYWRDTGLLHALLNVADEDDLLTQPWVGASWEGFVIEQILSVRSSRGETCEAYFFRSHDGYEVDLVLKTGRLREVIEIKLTSGPAPEDLARLDKVAAMVAASRRVLLCRVRNSVTTGSRWVVNLRDYLRAT
jgi:predicted AAA+ superfamily ATPase